jgi:hypothetical protein
MSNQSNQNNHPTAAYIRNLRIAGLRNQRDAYAEGKVPVEILRELRLLLESK